MRRPLVAFVPALLICLGGCSRTAIIERMAPEDVRKASQAAVSDLRTRHLDALKGTFVDGFRKRDLDADLAKMEAIVPDEEPRAVSPAAYFVQTGTGGTRYQISYEYQFTRGWVLAQFSWVRANGRLRISEFHVYPMRESLEEMNAFTLRGKGPTHYLVLLLGGLAAALSVFALVKCIRMQGLKGKWRWILFILVGFGAFHFNWSTGQWSVSLLSFQLLSFSVFAPFGDPITVGVSVPVGAVVFLGKLRSLRRTAEARGAPPPAEDGG